MTRGFFLPIATEGDYLSYINVVSVRYGLIASYLMTFSLFLVLDVGAANFSLYQLGGLFLINLMIEIYFLYSFNRQYGLKKIAANDGVEQPIICIIKSLIALAFIGLLSFFLHAFFAKEIILTNIIIMLVFPYFFVSLFNSGLNEGIKGFLELTNKKAN